MKRLNAAQARELADKNSVDGIITGILEMIQEKAEDGKTNLNIRNYGFGSSNLYAGGFSVKQQEVVDELIHLGYRARIKVEEKQLVDIYLLISW